MREPEVTFNMDLANAPTSERFCYEAAAVLGQEVSSEDAEELSEDNRSEYVSEVVDEWTDKLENAGYVVRWDCGDVVVYDCRDFSADELDAFCEEMFA